MLGKRDIAAALVLFALPAALIAGLFLMGRTVFWGDLTYIHHPWRALAAEYVQRGMLPLWNPYVYLGMPLAAQMQSAVWYPGTVLFYLFPFAAGLAIFHALHYSLAGFFTFLWLRRERLGRTAALGGAFVFMGSGSLVSRLPFLNHLSCLAFVPAFLLLRRRPWLLGLAFAICFLSGYPTILAGGVLIAFVLPRLCARTRGGYRNGSQRKILGEVSNGSGAAAGSAAAICVAVAGMLAAALAACLLIPAARLALHTHRGAAGLDLEDTLRFGLAFSDWRQWISPLLVPRAEFSPSIFWWKTCYLGAAGWLAIALAMPRLRRGVLAGLAAYLILAAILLLGDSFSVSLWLWSHLLPLRYIRYPGNLAYLSLPALALLAAAGLQGRWRSGLLAGAIAVELAGYAVCSHPTVPRDYFTDAGPLVRQLQAELGGDRYLLSPRSLQWHRGSGQTTAAAALDLKHRLYGLTNAPFHLRSVGNFGEPLVPAASYDFMDFMYRQPSLDAAAPYLPAAAVRVLLAKDELPSRALVRGKPNLWEQYWFRAQAGPAGRGGNIRGAALKGGKRVRDVARTGRRETNGEAPGHGSGLAYWFDLWDGAALPADVAEADTIGTMDEIAEASADGAPPDFSRGRPLSLDTAREDRFIMSERTDEGWVYLAEPRAEGWHFWLNGRPVKVEPALGAFEKVRVPSGAWRLAALYAPLSWMVGLWITLLAILGSSAYWYNRALANLE